MATAHAPTKDNSSRSRKRLHSTTTTKSSPPQPLPPDHEFLQKFHQEYLVKKQQRRLMQRKAANARERKRVGRINGAFTQLEAKLQESNVSPPNDQCLSKIKTLRSAINYIDSLKRLLHDADSSMPSSPSDAQSDCMYATDGTDGTDDFGPVDFKCGPPPPPPPPPPPYHRTTTFSAATPAAFPSFQHSLADFASSPSLRDIWPEYYAAESNSSNVIQAGAGPTGATGSWDRTPSFYGGLSSTYSYT
ncbi:transcription factor SUM-1-like [Oscarella lobularis]|uniref:transcription factor SUM-1-like n=1 Tax=Oscarella lobularis TaxID=121494 RepID=UPI003313314A